MMPSARQTAPATQLKAYTWDGIYSHRRDVPVEGGN